MQNQNCPACYRQPSSTVRWAGHLFFMLGFCVLSILGAVVPALADNLPLQTAKAMSLLRPESGYRLELFAAVNNARSIAVAPELKGIFVGTRGPNLYFVRDADGDGKGEEVNLIADDFKMANGIAYKLDSIGTRAHPVYQSAGQAPSWLAIRRTFPGSKPPVHRRWRAVQYLQGWWARRYDYFHADQRWGTQNLCQRYP